LPRAQRKEREPTVRYTATPFGFIMVLEPGDELMGCLIRIARYEEVEAGVLNGIGAVRDVELGFYHHDDDRRGRSGYERHRFRGPLEACSLTGTLSLLDGEPFPHVHGVFGRPDCSTVGGHVFTAACHITVELAIHTAPLPLKRGPVDFCDLKLMQLEEQP
jgi:uncharacterized protein